MSLLAVGEFGDALELIKMYGPFFLAVVFFLWRDYRREDRLTDRIDTLETEQRQVILPLVQHCASVITKCTTVMERVERYLER